MYMEINFQICCPHIKEIFQDSGRAEAKSHSGRFRLDKPRSGSKGAEHTKKLKQQIKAASRDGEK